MTELGWNACAGSNLTAKQNKYREAHQKRNIIKSRASSQQRKRDAKQGKIKQKSSKSTHAQAMQQQKQYQNRTGEQRTEPSNAPFWRVQILTTIRVALGKAKQCKRYC